MLVRIFLLALCLSVLLTTGGVTPRSVWAAEPFNVVFFCPTSSSHHPFWGNYIGFMEAAAHDLGVELDVVYSDDRFKMLDDTELRLAQKDKPDCIIAVHHRGMGTSVLEAAGQHGVPVYFVNTAIPEEDVAQVGQPRGKFPNWIGQMYPDDVEGGRLLAEALIEAARKKCDGSHGELVMAAISGSHASPAALGRNKGLEAALADNPDVSLDRLVFGRWKYDTAYEKARLLLQNNPNIRVIWAASDTMAHGVLDGVASLGSAVDGDVVSGGFDWTETGMDAVAKGDFVATVGGHFMEGAWALVMIHDYLSGKDFADIGLVHELEMILLDSGNVAIGKNLVTPECWGRIDFRSFSRVYHPAREYDFSLAFIERHFRRAGACVHP